MGLYLFRNPVTGEVKEVSQKMDSDHVYVEGDIKYERVFVNPQASIDTKINVFDKNDFLNKTRDKKGSLGNLFDLSKECSIKREEKAGKDSLKDEYYKNYTKRRTEKSIHPDKIKDAAKEKLNKMDVIVE